MITKNAVVDDVLYQFQVILIFVVIELQFSHIKIIKVIKLLGQTKQTQSI